MVPVTIAALFVDRNTNRFSVILLISSAAVSRFASCCCTIFRALTGLFRSWFHFRRTAFRSSTSRRNCRSSASSAPRSDNSTLVVVEPSTSKDVDRSSGEVPRSLWRDGGDVRGASGTV